MKPGDSPVAGRWPTLPDDRGQRREEVVSMDAGAKKQATARPVAEWAASHANIQFTVEDVWRDMQHLRRKSVEAALLRFSQQDDFPLDKVGQHTGVYIFRSGVRKSSLLKLGDMLEVILQPSDGVWLARDSNGSDILFRVSIAKIS